MPLLNEPDSSDLPNKVGAAWQEFAEELVKALPTLPAGAELHVILDPTAGGTGVARYEVSVMTVPEGLLARAVSNASLPEGYQLHQAAIGSMVALGWSPPGVEDGAGDDFGTRFAPDDAAGLARIVARTLWDIYHAPHPAFLVYLAYDVDGELLVPPPLGAARPVADLNLVNPLVLPEPPEPDDEDLLRDQVRAVVAAMLQAEQVPTDSDGDICVRAGSAMVFVKVHQDPPLVDVRSPLLTDVEPTVDLYAKLSELTNRMPVGRLYSANRTVWASVPVFGRSFQPTHLMLAVNVMTGLADELDDRLRNEFGGRRFFGDDSPDQEASTGFFL